MTDTTFNKGTVIQPDWLNDTNTLVYHLVGNGVSAPTTAADVRDNLGITALLAAKAGNGVNSDITSLTGLNTALDRVAMDSRLQGLTATLDGGGNLVVTSEPMSLDFRSSTVTNGAVSQVKIPNALSLTIPAAATLGVPDNTACFITIVAADNAGSVQLGAAYCANTTGSNASPLFEHLTSSVNDISSGANSTNTIYGVTPATPITYRVVGGVIAIRLAGVWTSVYRVIPYGSEAYRYYTQPGGNASQWVDKKASRSLGSTYSAGNVPVQVAFTVSATANNAARASVDVTVNSLRIATINTSEYNGTTYIPFRAGFSFLVPAGGTYSIATNGAVGNTIQDWCELS